MNKPKEEDMERLTILETKMEHVDLDITNTKSDIREIRNSIWGVVFVVFVSFTTLYIHTDIKTDRISKEIMAVQMEVNQISLDIKSIKALLEKPSKEQ